MTESFSDQCLDACRPLGRPDRRAAGERRLSVRLPAPLARRQRRRPELGDEATGLSGRHVCRLRPRDPLHPGRPLRDHERRHRSRARHPDGVPEPAGADAACEASRCSPASSAASRRWASPRRSSTSRSACSSASGSRPGPPAPSCSSLFAILISIGFGALGAFAALRTGSGEAVQSLFPVFFVFLFLSSMSLPRNLIETTWFRTVATLNPVSYLIEGIRSLIIIGWDREALALGFGIALAITVVALFLGEPRAADEAGALVRLAGRTGRGLADAAQRLHEPLPPHSLARLPALLLRRLCGRALAGAQCARLRLPARLHRLPVRLRAAPVGRLRRRLHRLRDRTRLRERLCAPAPPGGAEPEPGSSSVTRPPRSSAGW